MKWGLYAKNQVNYTQTSQNASWGLYAGFYGITELKEPTWHGFNLIPLKKNN